MGNIDLSGQLVYVGGTYEDRTSTVIKKDYSAFAFEAAGKYQIGPGMFAGLEVFYSTGNDANSSDKIKMYQVGTSNSEARAIFGNDRTVIFWMNAAQLGYWHNRQWGFEGMGYGRANFEFSPSANVRFNLNYLYIIDTSSGTPSPLGATTRKVINSPIGAQQFKDEDFVGHEINLITTIQIYKNLAYNIGLGYFIPGPIYDAYDSITGNKTKSAESCLGFNTNLRVVF
jgi:hypothetical protein